ncbi:MAG: RNA methyltransferase [Bacteroidia bacterium]|nr:MAG: RNA methyltransferase [Bacteroidia bacterium]
MNMLSINNIKLVNSLQLKKQRDKSELYVIEGDKMVREYLTSEEEIVWLFAKPEWIASLPGALVERVPNIIAVSYDELKRISSLKTPHNAMAIVHKKVTPLTAESLLNGLTIVLDSIQDPGNLGTIIRLAGWFGIDKIICSHGCVDLYNPKVLQATMGALLHVVVHYTEILPLMGDARAMGLPVYAAALEGESIYEAKLPGSAILIFGNESKGISAELMAASTHSVMIPSFGNRGAGIDSLNAAMAVAVVCSEFRRRSLPGQ